jgi:hypothetical protein
MNKTIVYTLFSLVSLFGFAGLSSAAFASGVMTMHVGQNVTSGSWTIQLQDLANIGSQINAPAAIAIYYNGVQTNETTITQGQTAPINVNGNLLYVYMNSSFSGTYAYQKWANITAWYNTTPTYVGQNLTSGPWAVQLQDLAQTTNGINAPAALAIYYNGNLANETVANPGTISEFSSPTSPIIFSTMYLELNSTYSGLYAYQKWAKMEAWYSPAIVSTTFIEEGLPSGATFTVTFDNQSQSTLTSISNSLMFTYPESAPLTNSISYSIPVVYANATFYTPKIPPISLGGVTIINFTPYTAPVTTTIPTTTVPPTRPVIGSIKLKPGQSITTPYVGISIQLVNTTGTSAVLNVSGVTASTNLVTISVHKTVQVMVADTANPNGNDTTPVNITLTAVSAATGQSWAEIAPIGPLSTQTVSIANYSFGDWYLDLVRATPGMASFNIYFYHYFNGTPCTSPACSKEFRNVRPQAGSITAYTFSNATSNYTMYLYLGSVSRNTAYSEVWESHQQFNQSVTTRFAEAGLPIGANFTVTFDGSTKSILVRPGVIGSTLYFTTSPTANGGYTIYNVVYKGVTYDATLVQKGLITPGSSAMVLYRPVRTPPPTTTVSTTTTTIRPTTTIPARPTTTTTIPPKPPHR